MNELESVKDGQVGDKNEALVFSVGNAPANVYLKLFMKKEIAQQISSSHKGFREVSE